MDLQTSISQQLSLCVFCLYQYPLPTGGGKRSELARCSARPLFCEQRGLGVSLRRFAKKRALQLGAVAGNLL